MIDNEKEDCKEKKTNLAIFVYLWSIKTKMYFDETQKACFD